MIIHPTKKAEVKNKTQIKALLFDNTFIIILVEYSNYGNVFLAKNIAKLLKLIKIIHYIIKLK